MADGFQIVKLEHLRDRPRRGLAFLQSSMRLDIDAKQVFDRLKPKKQEDMMHRFEYWLDGGVFDKYFHGFPNDPGYKHLWLFKWSQSGAEHRFYGFLTNPRLRDRAFLACILVCHDQKPGGSRHDPRNFALAESLRLNLDVVREVKSAFPEVNNGPLDRRKH